MDQIKRAFNKLLNKLLSDNAAHYSLFLLPFVVEFGIIFITEPLFFEVVSEKGINLLLLVNLLVFIVEFLEFITLEGLNLHILEGLESNNWTIQFWHLVLNMLFETTIMTVVSASSVPARFPPLTLVVIITTTIDT